MQCGQHMTDEMRAKLSAACMGIKFSEETKARISAAAMGNRNSLGHVTSPETRTKISAAKINPSAEVRAKMSAVMMGHKVSSETRAKISVGIWKGGRSMAWSRHDAKRRLLGFIPLNNPFPGCEGHHVDKERVINLLKELHRSVRHRQTDGRGMAAMNAVAFNFLFKQEVEAAIPKVTL